MESVILTGASGFVGGHCINHLLEAGYKVHAIYNNEKHTPNLPKKENLEWHKVNLLDEAQVAALIKPLKASHMLHLAWYAEPGKFWDSRLNWEWLRASINLQRVFNEAGGKRFVGAGSCAEYDWSPGKLSENTALTPATLYGQCKSSLYSSALQNATMSGTEFAWGRIFWLYGPGEDRRRIVPHVITCLLRDEEAQCTEGMQERDFMYVDDVARAFVDILKSNMQGAINIGSGKPISIRALVQTIGKLIDKRSLIVLGGLPEEKQEAPLVVADVGRLHNELKFQPSYSIEKGLLLTLEWWRQELKKPSQLAISRLFEPER